MLLGRRVFPDGEFGKETRLAAIGFFEPVPAAGASCARPGITCTPETDARERGRHRWSAVVAAKAAMAKAAAGGAPVGGAGSATAASGVAQPMMQMPAAARPPVPSTPYGFLGMPAAKAADLAAKGKGSAAACGTGSAATGAKGGMAAAVGVKGGKAATGAKGGKAKGAKGGKGKLMARPAAAEDFSGNESNPWRPYQINSCRGLMVGLWLPWCVPMETFVRRRRIRA